MKLVVEILTGSLFHVEIGEDATVQDLKNKIGNQENLPENRLILMLDADEERYLLDKDEVTLKDYGVQDGSHIYIFFQVPPSATQPISASSSSTSSHDSASKESSATQVIPPPPGSSSSDSEEE